MFYIGSGEIGLVLEYVDHCFGSTSNGHGSRKKRETQSGWAIGETVSPSMLLDNEAIYEVVSDLQCNGCVIPDSNRAQLAFEMTLPNETIVTGHGLFSMEGVVMEFSEEPFTCSGNGILIGYHRTCPQ